MTNEGILSAIGNTPLVRLARVMGDAPFRLFGKLEAVNPGGSIKDRPALSIIRWAMESGAIRPNTVVVESSSGNMGIGLAQACSYFGLRFICVVDPKTTSQNIALLKAYGAEIEMVKAPDLATGEFLNARIARVQLILNTIDNSYWPNQYSNLSNPYGHRRIVAEIRKELKEEIDYLFCATSTCAIRPALFQDDLADECVHVSDLDCIVGCRRLAQREAILSGGSSGAVLMAVEQIKHRIREGACCVIIIADRGERYLDTIYSDEWVREHFGTVPGLQ